MSRPAEAPTVSRRSATAALTTGLMTILYRPWSAWAQARAIPGFSFVVVSDTHLGYFTPMTIESGPLKGSTRVCLKPASRIQAAQSAPV